MSASCENCGSKVYGGRCTNCHEELYIADHWYELEMPTQSWSEEFRDKVIQQTKEVATHNSGEKKEGV